jgi:hypothetical protein
MVKISNVDRETWIRHLQDFWIDTQGLLLRKENILEKIE